MEPNNNGFNPLMFAVPSYACLKPGSSKINKNLKNHASKSMTIKAKTIVAQPAAANAVPTMLASRNPQETEENVDKILNSLIWAPKNKSNLNCLKKN